MVCIPSKNELLAVEFFVQCINVFYSRKYQIECCPEEDSSSPNPEALYEDSENGQRLAVERKSIVYPDDHIRRHQHDHRMMKILWGDKMPSEISRGPFVLEMPFCHRSKKDDDVDLLAIEICEFIRENIDEIHQEGMIAFESDGPIQGIYNLYRKHLDNWGVMVDGPFNQLTVRMSGPGRRIPRFDWRELSESTIPRQMDKIFKACSKKFEKYNEDQKILLIERYGEIRGPLNAAFEDFIHSVAKPELLDEIWDAWLEIPDYDEPYWVYTRLWAKNPSLPLGWQRAEVCCRVGDRAQDSSDNSDVFWFTEE